MFTSYTDAYMNEVSKNAKLTLRLLTNRVDYTIMTGYCNCLVVSYAKNTDFTL